MKGLAARQLVKVTLFRSPGGQPTSGSAALQECLHAVALLGAPSADEIAQHLGISISTARRRLNALIENGSLTRKGKGPATRYTAFSQPKV